MTILGLILLLIGVLAKIAILRTIGVVIALVGLALLVARRSGLRFLKRRIFGRRRLFKRRGRFF